jgi:hypothetical protein
VCVVCRRWKRGVCVGRVGVGVSGRSMEERDGACALCMCRVCVECGAPVSPQNWAKETRPAPKAALVLMRRLKEERRPFFVKCFALFLWRATYYLLERRRKKRAKHTDQSRREPS